MADAYDVNKDRFPVNPSAQWPAREAVAVVPSDTKDLTAAIVDGGSGAKFYAKALYIGVAGDVKVTLAGDNVEPSSPIVFKAVPVGILNVQVRRVWSTGTAATNMVALTD